MLLNCWPPGFRDRHWELVSNTVGFPVKGGANLFQILDMGLDEYVSKFEKISEASTKEYNLELAMEQMVEDWSDMEFNIESYSDTGTYTLSSMDNIQVRAHHMTAKAPTPFLCQSAVICTGFEYWFVLSHSMSPIL